MKRRGRHIVVVAFAAGALAACNLIAGFESEYVVGSGTEGGTIDSPVDTDSSTDGPVVLDGNSDAPTDGGTDGPLCPVANELFCDDFEDADAALFGWSDLRDFEGDASVRVLPAVGHGSSAGLDVVMDKNASGTSIAAWLAKAVTGGSPLLYRKYQLDFDFEVLSKPLKMSYAALGILTFPSGGPDREHGIGVYQSDLISKLQPTAATVPSTGTWQHARVVLERVDGSADMYDRITFASDQTGVLKEIEKSPPSYFSPDGGGVQVRLGTFNTGTGVDVLHARFDNVVVRGWN